MFRGPLELPVDGLAPPAFADSAVTLGIRPEHVEVLRLGDAAGLAAVVDLVERVGPDSYLLVLVGGATSLTARVDAASPIREGDRISIRLPLQHVRLFDASGTRVVMEAR
jgi:ABC-type sugar transport system ATPase subunit